MIGLLGGVSLFSWQRANAPHLQKSQALGEVAGDGTDYPALYTNHRDYRCGGTCATKNLIPEEASFEVGAADQIDGLAFFRRMGYETYAPGSRNLFSSNPSVGYNPPAITTERFVDGAKSFKVVNTNRDGLLFDFNWIQVPTTGKYVFSVYAKAENLGDNATQILSNLSIRDKDWAEQMSAGDRWLTESPAGNSGWVRLSIATNVDLQAGEFYRPEFRISSRMAPGLTGTFYLDAIQFELAENQSNPQPSSFAYQTTAQELFAYTSSDQSGSQPKRGNLYWSQDAETIYAQVQLREAAPLSADSQLRWWLYDANGDSTNQSTALASGSQLVQPNAESFQTVSMNLASILASAAPDAQKGIWKIVFELWDPAGSTMIDREFLVLGRLEESPYVGQSLPDSFFGNHVSLGQRLIEYSGFFDRYFSVFQANRPVNEYYDIAEKLGIKTSREFGLLEQDLVDRREELGLADAFIEDYVDEMAAHSIDLLPVIGQRHGNGNADAEWQNFVSEVVQAYGSKVGDYEVLNEPHDDTFPYVRYYGYLWRSEEVIHSVLPDANVLGPSSSFQYFADLLGYTDGSHGTGFDLFTSSAAHIYFRYSNGMRDIPEDTYGNGFTDVDGAIRKWQGIFNEAAPDVASRKTTWITEIGINQARLYDDIPAIAYSAWTGDEAIFYNHMSGSVPIAKKLASDFLRYELYQMANGIIRSYEFGLFVPTIHDSLMYGFFDYDGTPLPIAAGYAQMTKRLEQGEYIRRVEQPDLRANATYQDKSRAFLFSAPDLDQPGATRPVAVVWNWTQDGVGGGLLDIPLQADRVLVEDMFGNPVDIGSGASFSLPLDPSPKYIIGESGMTMSEFAYAFDSRRPNAPFAPTATVEGERVKITISAGLNQDVATYRVYREPASGGTAEYVGDATGEPYDSTFTWYDDPPTGSWRYRASAVEQGTDFETARSGVSQAVSVNDSPSWVDQIDLTVHEDDLVTFTLTATDPNPEDTLTLSSPNLPFQAELQDNGDRTASFTWRPGLDQAGIFDIRFDVFDGRDHVVMDVRITVEDGRSNCTPNWACTPWSACADSRQTRLCTDENACGTDAGRPQELLVCDSTAPDSVDDLTIQ